MASEEHLVILKQGVAVWNEWRYRNPNIIPYLVCSDLTAIDLTGMDLNGANLIGANLSATVLSKTSFCGASLGSANLRDSNLRGCYFYGADLQVANFEGADLREAKLMRAQALGTNFIGAKFTGACIEDWSINSTTRLDDIDCEYFYWKYDRIEGYSKREPSNRKFILGEFTQLLQADRSYSNLAVLDQLINRFEKLLDDVPEGSESIFHDFLKENPILLDIYVSRKDIISKPRFYYPPGELQNGKTYVEPDFVIKYAGNKYKLVELEKPEKRIATKQGQPTSGVTQAAFQTKEWDDYIRNYIECIRDEYPGIANNRSYLVVIGRRNERSIGIGRDPARYMGLINSNYPYEEICTYDDLLDRAKQAHAALIALSV